MSLLFNEEWWQRCWKNGNVFWLVDSGVWSRVG